MTRRQRKVTRNSILFAAGLIGISLETLFSLRYHQAPDSTLVLAFLAMVGLPVYSWADSKSQSDEKPSRRSGRHVDDE